MINFKKTLVSAALAVSAIAFGQGTFTSSNYPQSYDNFNANTSAEKLLTAKELVDIKINSMMNDPVLRNANWGFVVYDPKTKKNRKLIQRKCFFNSGFYHETFNYRHRHGIAWRKISLGHAA